MNRSTFVAGTALAVALPRAAGAVDAVINLGIIPTDTNMVASYAQSLGSFKKNGLDVRIQTMTSGPVIVNAVTGGALDIGASNVGSLASARSRGLPVKLVVPCAIIDVGDVGYIIAVSKDSTIQTAADLNNKIVGLAAVRTIQQAAFLAWMDKFGGDSKSVKFVEVPFPAMAPALEAHRVDAVLPSEPFTSMMRSNVRSLGKQFAAFRLPIPIFAFFATESWLAAHADAAGRFASTIRQTALWANGHRRETAVMVVQASKLDPQLANSMDRATYGTTLDPVGIQGIIEAMVHAGFMEKSIDANELIWHASARQAQP